MLKRIIAVFAVLLFAVGILLISLLRVNSCIRPSFAVSSLKFYVSPQPTATASSEEISSAVPRVNYYLPYPGILPDHPFYKIKMLRDWFWLALTRSSLKRVELLSLFADKRIGAGEVLIKGNKPALGISTLIKGEKYLERAISETERLKKKGVNVENASAKIKGAALKYEEILTDLKESVSSEGKASLDELIKTVKNLQERASTL